MRNAQYFYLTDWSGGKYTSPGMEGSRSGGLIAATWAAMVQFGYQGYLGYARQIFETSFAMQDAVRSHPQLRIVGRPTFLFSFTSDDFDIYHVNDFMRTTRVAVQRTAVSQCPAHGGHPPPDATGRGRRVRSRSGRRGRLRRRARGDAAQSGAIYGGVAGGMTDDADEFIRAVMADMLDAQSVIPPG